MSVSQAAEQLVEVVKNKKEEGQSQLGILAFTSVLYLILLEQNRVYAYTFMRALFT